MKALAFLSYLYFKLNYTYSKLQSGIHYYDCNPTLSNTIHPYCYFLTVSTLLLSTCLTFEPSCLLHCNICVELWLLQLWRPSPLPALPPSLFCNSYLELLKIECAAWQINSFMCQNVRKDYVNPHQNTPKNTLWFLYENSLFMFKISIFSFTPINKNVGINC